MTARETDVPALEVGERVWFGGYGEGVVDSVTPFGMRIAWDNIGSMDHDTSFARHLKRLDRQQRGDSL